MEKVLHSPPDSTELVVSNGVPQLLPAPFITAMPKVRFRFWTKSNAPSSPTLFFGLLLRTSLGLSVHESVH